LKKALRSKTTSPLRGLAAGAAHVLGGDLRGLLAGVAVVLCAAGLLWWTPMSPLALVRADGLYASGKVEAATSLYDAIGERGLRERDRIKALERCAQIWWVEIKQPQEASARLTALLRMQLGEPKRYAALRMLAQVQQQLGRDEEAARSLLLAAKQSCCATGVTELGLALSASERAENEPLARKIVSKLSEIDGFEAIFLRARHELSQDRADVALELFDHARLVALDESQQKLADVGAISALERLGRIEEALVGIAERELAPGFEQGREKGMLKRQQKARW